MTDPDDMTFVLDVDRHCNEILGYALKLGSGTILAPDSQLNAILTPAGGVRQFVISEKSKEN